MTDMSAVIVPKSDQWNADDFLVGPRTFTITDVKIRGGEEQPVSISLQGTPRVFRPCKSMSRVLVFAWGLNPDAYAGRSLTLYRDPKVRRGGLEVGGIRISHMSHIDRDQIMMLTESKTNRKPYKVEPLAVERPAATALGPSTPAVDPAAVMAEARTVASKGSEAFRAWFRAHPEKREGVKPILDELKIACEAADAALIDDDPFGLPPLDPTPEEIAAALAEAEVAAKAQALV